MDIKKNNIILIVLVLALFVQVFNTASLYSSFSNLSDIMKFIGSAFIGISAEIGIFACVFAGSSKAGKYFAILSFFVGLLFHSNFIDIQSIDFWTTKKFISSTLLQLINSSLVWFLSELYVTRTEGERNKIDYEKYNKNIITMRAEHNELKESCNIIFEELNLLEQKKTDLENDIKRLQKVKAGKSIVKAEM